MRKVCPKSINIKISNPVLHGRYHSSLLAFILMVNLYYIIPIIRSYKISFLVFYKKLRICFGPYIIPRSMVGNPINNYFHTKCMHFYYKRFKIFFSTKFTIDAFMVLNGVITSHYSFAFYNSNWVYWHQPQNFYTHIFQSWQVFCKCIKRSFRRVLAYVYFIHTATF